MSVFCVLENPEGQKLRFRGYIFSRSIFKIPPRKIRFFVIRIIQIVLFVFININVENSVEKLNTKGANHRFLLNFLNISFFELKLTFTLFIPF